MNKVIFYQEKMMQFSTMFYGKEIEVYDQDDGTKRMDHHVVWLETGERKLWIREFTLDGKATGMRTVYYPDTGLLKISEFYRDGERQGERKMWHANGQLQMQGFYKDGKLEGTVQSWYDNSMIEKKMVFRDGKREGTAQSWYENGIPHSLAYLQNDSEQEYRCWYRNGYISRLTNHRTGKCKAWYSDGRLHVKKSHNNEGEYKFWNKTGKLRCHEYWRGDNHVYDFAVGSIVFRKLKIRLYMLSLRKKYSVLNPFIISDLTMLLVHMLHI